MYNLSKRNEVLKAFAENVKVAAETAKMYGSIKEKMEANDGDMAKYLINMLIKSIESAVPEGITLPNVSKYVSLKGTAGNITIVDVTLRNNYKSDEEFCIKREVILSDRIYEDLVEFLEDGYSRIVEDVMVKENLTLVNQKMDELTKAASNSFKVSFVSELGNEGKNIASITDDEVVFVADTERVFGLDELLMFSEPDEDLRITAENIQKSFDLEVATFATAQTTPQFVGAHAPIVNYISGISKLVKAFTLIKKVYSKNVEKLRGNKEAFAYKKDGDVYSVLHVNEDKTSEVVLTPFNVKTLEVVK